MKLTLNKFHVQDIQFAEASSFCLALFLCK